MSNDGTPISGPLRRSVFGYFFMPYPSTTNPAIPLNKRNPRSENRSLRWQDVAAPMPLPPPDCSMEESDAFYLEQNLQQIAILEGYKHEAPWVQQEIDDLRGMVTIMYNDNQRN
jgi:hypothetical protein